MPSGRHARRAMTASGAGSTTPLALEAPPVAAPAGDAEATADPLAQVDVESMLAVLASDSDALSEVAGRFSSKGTVAIFAVGGAALLTVLGLAAMFILGSFMH